MSFRLPPGTSDGQMLTSLLCRKLVYSIKADMQMLGQLDDNIKDIAEKVAQLSMSHYVLLLGSTYL